MTTPHFDELKIKAIVLSELSRRGVLTSGTVVASEFPIPKFSSRVDLALLCNRFMAGERKSGRDSLERLEAQAKAYLRVFETVILVAAEKHVEKAKALVPESVGIWTLSTCGRINVTQRAIKRAPQAKDLVEILTKDELRRLIGVRKGIDFSRRQLVEAALSKTPSQIRAAVRSVFQSRFEETSQKLWKCLAHHEIDTAHVRELSRFYQKRQLYTAKQLANEQAWKEWSTRVAETLSGGAQSFHSSSVS
jgi:hypothetical protein